MAEQAAYNFDGIADAKPAAKPAAVADVPRDARGIPQVSSDTSDDPHPLFQMLGPLASPQTFTDFARLLILPVDEVRKALAGALTLGQARSAATSTAQTVKAAPATVSTATKGFAKIGDVVDPDVIGLASPRLGNAVKLAQRMRGAPAASEGPVSTPGYPRLTTAPAAEAAPVAEAAAPVATNSLPNQKLLNELAIAARRAGVKLTPETEQAAIAAVGEGASPAEAVGKVASASPAEAVGPAVTKAARAKAPTAPKMAAQAAEAAKFRLSSAESKEYMRLLKAGKSHQQARELIESQRGLASRLGLPSAEQARQAVADRNASGRWE